MKEKKENCEEKRKELSTKVEDLETRKKELEKEVEKLREINKELKNDTTLMGEHLRTMKKKYEELNKTNDELLEKYAALRKEDKKENRKLSSELEKNREKLQKKEDQLNDLEKRLDQKEDDLKELEKELEKREARVSELENMIAKKDSAVNALRKRVREALLSFKDREGLTVEQKNGKIYVSLEANLLFGTGSTKVDKEGKQALIDLAKGLEGEEDLRIMVEGHTDDQKVNPNPRYKDNWDLSVLRATSVIRIMLKNSKLQPKRVIAAGRSKYHPVSEEEKAKNRRIEIVLTPNLEKLFKIIEETKVKE
ncbi:MAG: OmpA family protein [Flavobacteriales bacterium]